MPFKSEAQRRYLWMNHPHIARKWVDEERAKDRKKKLAVVKKLSYAEKLAYVNKPLSIRYR